MRCKQRNINNSKKPKIQLSHNPNQPKMQHHRSLSNPNLFHNTVASGQLIKFPTITKLTYDGQASQNANVNLNARNQYRSTLNKLVHKNSQQMLEFASATQAGFRLVQLPAQEHLMRICMMNLTDNNSKNKLNPDQSIEKQSVTRNNIKKALSRKQKSTSMLTSINFRKHSTSSSLTTPNIPPSQPNPNKPQQNNKNNGNNNENSQKRTKSNSLIKLKINNNLHLYQYQHQYQNKININDFYLQIITALALLNGGLTVNQGKGFQRIRRVKVDKGNNGYLVKQIVKRRSWWNGTEDARDANFIWTEKEIKSGSQGWERQRFYAGIQQEQEAKVNFQRNIDHVFSLYPKVLQLFFTDYQIFKMSSDNTQTNKYKRSYTIYNFLSNKRPTRKIFPQNTVILNHIPNHSQITSKKQLYKNLWCYYAQKQKSPYNSIPKTYHLTAFDWQQKIQFIKQQEKCSTTQAWFLKPGENTNRGRGIQIFRSTPQALDHIVRNPPKSHSKTLILQQYINPLLYSNRKFDIRCYILCIQAFEFQSFYWYEQGYIRTSSSRFTMRDNSVEIHLTNDAVQKQYDNYEKYQNGNKLSYGEIQRYLREEYGFQFGAVLKDMKGIAGDVCRAAREIGVRNGGKGDGDEREDQGKGKKKGQSKGKEGYQNYLYFQLFGMDYIISKEGKPFLLQVNTNPCLETNSNLLARVIPQVIQNTLRIVTDVYLPNRSVPTNNNINATNNNQCPDWAQNFILNNKYSLIYRRQLENQSTQKKQQQQQNQLKQAQQQKVHNLQNMEHISEQKQVQVQAQVYIQGPEKQIRNEVEQVQMKYEPFFKFGTKTKLKITPQI